ncbi:hypothetical protein EDD76_106131 [Kineothrix alysoides]|uniref:DnaJ-like protein n=1 Tax=Kineothrix alysoides TaxID=1469948 RepID=A0A4R1QZQ3_9FIRM|nr:hypothetical protein [Kineothrix alysoides]TCL58478.1 hypothetical protein EDD76_106131 [Kineothrix alysoides]
MNFQEEKELSFDLEEILKNGSGDELNELKIWLFKENVRMENLKREISELQEKFAGEKKQFQDEMRTLSHSMEIDRKRLQQENTFFDQKMKILQKGFEQLEEDRHKFQKERDKFEAKKEVYEDGPSFFGRSDLAGMLFKGVNSRLALKKRYKDLIKMFHPDNVAGDHEMVQIINREYEELRRAYDIGKQA